MYVDVLPLKTKRALEKLADSDFFTQTGAYLAGGTALTIFLGHRHSHDLDFFTSKDFNEEQTSQFISDIGRLNIEKTGWKTILGTFDGIKFSLFHYKYPLIATQKKFLKTANLASLKDIAAMKIEAIAKRGTKRDFIDLYYLSKQFPLRMMLEFYDQKFQNLASNKIYILRSLVYFADAEPDKMPEMIKDTLWTDIMEFFKTEVRKLSETSGII